MDIEYWNRVTLDPLNLDILVQFWSTTRHAAIREKDGSISVIDYMIELAHIQFCVVVICNSEKEKLRLRSDEAYNIQGVQQ